MKADSKTGNAHPGPAGTRTTTTKAYSYIRFSTPEQALGDSERRQINAARDYATAHGLELDESLTFADKGISAFHGGNRKAGALGTFLDAVKNGIVAKGSHFLVESVDRISRQNPWDAIEAIKLIIDQHITVVTLSDRKSYSYKSVREDMMSLVYLSVLFMRAHEESKTKSERVGAAWANNRKRAAEDGRLMTRTAPAWIEVRGELGGPRTAHLIPERATIVRGIFRDYLKGVGLESIARGLNDAGVEPFGKAGEANEARHWHRSYISKILDNPAAIGIGQTGRDYIEDGRRMRKLLDPIPGYYPAAIDRETWDRVRAMRADKSKETRRGHGPTGATKNLFGGLLRCPQCGGAMFLKDRGVKQVATGTRTLKYHHRYVMCYAGHSSKGTLCVRTTARYDRIEDAFFDHADYIVGTMPGGAATEELEEQLRNIEAGVDAARDQRGNLLEAIKRNPLPALSDELETVDRAIASAISEARALEQRIAAASPKMVEARANELAKLLRTADRMKASDRQHINALLKTLLSGIVVDYDDATLRFQWAHGGESDCMYSFPITDDQGERTEAGKRAHKGAGGTSGAGFSAAPIGEPTRQQKSGKQRSRE
jgi:DNA invertase Pin-like site-specific DNA recombinase